MQTSSEASIVVHYTAFPGAPKDLFATKGIKTTWGAEAYRDQVIQYDATVVERLRDAGAVLVAKLSMGALAQGARWFAGVTRNPWVPDETNKTQAALQLDRRQQPQQVWLAFRSVQRL